MAIVDVIVTFDYLLVEGFNVAAALLVLGDRSQSLQILAYHSTYLLNGLLFAVLPSLLIALLSERRAVRGLFAGFAGLAIIFAVLAAFFGSMKDWAVLLSWTQAIAFVGIAAYLSFCMFALLGRLTGSDAYLMGFILIRAVFELLIPIQEAIFQVVGREDSAQIWNLLQFLQFSTISSQAGIVLALINSIRPKVVPAAPDQFTTAR